MSNTTTGFTHLTENFISDSNKLSGDQKEELYGSRTLRNRNDTVSENCNDDDMHTVGDINDHCDTPSILNELRLKNVNKLVIGHLNINSLPNKFDQLKLIIGKNIDILVITETKIDSSFPSSQFMIEGFSVPYRFDRNRSGGGVIVYIRDDIPNKQLVKHKLPEDTEGVFVEVNLRNSKWLIFGGCRPPCQSVEHFFKNVGFALDTYRQTYDKFFLAGDFNMEDTEPVLSEFLTNYDCKNLVKDKTCFKNPEYS